MGPGPEVIKLFPCSIQLSMKFYTLISMKILRNSAFCQGQISLECYFFMLINVKMPTFNSKKNYMLN